MRATEILPFGSSWEYYHPLDASDPAIIDSDFASTWQSSLNYDGPAFIGPSPAMFGYGSISWGQIATNIGTPASGDRSTAYFRTTFTTSQEFTRLEAEVLADDGGVLYLDGEIAARINYSGDDLYATPSDEVGEERETQTIYLDLILEPGEHILAFSLHNQSETSSDLGFELKIASL